ncbi:MAG: protein kinase [Thermodesulfobacteriota bacterium]
MSPVVPVRFGKYLLLDPIAVGGMAELYRAKMVGDEGFEKILVVKKILPHLTGEKDLVTAFIDEARLAAFLQHENIVRTHDFGKMGSDYFIAMEYLFGKNLRVLSDSAAKKALQMGLGEILYVAARMARGLAYAHAAKDYSQTPLRIVHRDVSPPNIFITYEGGVKIVDFGVAKAARQNTTTQFGVIKGKVGYMSPEQADGKPIDLRTDVFAAGAILYEMLTGSRLYSGDTLEVLAKARAADFTAPETLNSELPTCLLPVLGKALARNKEERYQSCDDMAADIEECIFQLGLRPSARSLSSFVREVFADRIAEEERSLMEVASVPLGESPPEAVEEAAPLKEKTQFLALERATGACPACNKPVSRTDAYCPWCDATILPPDQQVPAISTGPRDMIECPGCGNRVRGDFLICNQCGTPLSPNRERPGRDFPAMAGAAVAAGVDKGQAITVYYNAGRIYEEGVMDFLELAVADMGAHPVEGLRIKVSGNVLSAPLTYRAPFPLEPGRPKILKIPGFVPRSPGKDVLMLSFSGTPHGARPFYLLGETPVEVASRQDGQKSVNVNISAKGPLIVDMDQALPGADRTRRKKGPATDRWIGVSLYPDREKELRLARQFPEACVRAEEVALPAQIALALAALSPENAGKAMFLRPDGVSFRLVAGNTLLLGRKRDMVHVPAFLFPEEKNEHLNVKVSRVHCRIMVRDNRVFIRDTSANGTFLGKERLPQNEDVCLESGSLITVGGVLEMSLSIHTDGEKVLAVALSRINNRTEERYVLAPGPVPVGIAENLPITVPGAPPFLCALYYHPLKRGWYLRTLSGFAGGIKDVRLKMSHPLSFGAAKCGFATL